LPSSMSVTLEVVDWRRRVGSLYEEVRRIAIHDPAASHELWRSGRGDLFAHHPASPLLPQARRTFEGLPVAPYDPAWRLELEVGPATPRHHRDEHGHGR
jgi:uncharacterized protein (DUF1684 family)